MLFSRIVYLMFWVDLLRMRAPLGLKRISFSCSWEGKGSSAAVGLPSTMTTG